MGNTLLPSLSLIITSVLLSVALTTSQGGVGILSISINISSHSVMLSLMMFIANDFDISPAATLTVVESLL